MSWILPEIRCCELDYLEVSFWRATGVCFLDVELDYLEVSSWRATSVCFLDVEFSDYLLQVSETTLGERRT